MPSTYYEIQARTSRGWTNTAADILPGLPQSANRWETEEQALSAIWGIVFAAGRSRTDFRVIPIRVIAPLTPWPTDS
jgi:hypothetical protein